MRERYAMTGEETRAAQRRAEFRRERAEKNAERAELFGLIAQAIGHATTVKEAVENLEAAANAYRYAADNE